MLPKFTLTLMRFDLPWIHSIIAIEHDEQLIEEGFYSILLLLKDSNDVVFLFCIDDVPKVIKKISPTMLGLGPQEILGEDDVFTDYTEEQALEEIIKLV